MKTLIQIFSEAVDIDKKYAVKELKKFNKNVDNSDMNDIKELSKRILDIFGIKYTNKRINDLSDHFANEISVIDRVADKDADWNAIFRAMK